MAKIVGFDESVKKRCTCHSCSAIVEYVPNEVAESYTTDYTGCRDMYKYTTCPNCSKAIHVKGY